MLSVEELQVKEGAQGKGYIFVITALDRKEIGLEMSKEVELVKDKLVQCMFHTSSLQQP